MRNLGSTETFFERTLPFFQELLSRHEALFPEGVPLLIEGSGRLEFSKKQSAFLMGCLFFGIFDGGRDGGITQFYPPGTFFNIFCLSLLWRYLLKAPLQCIIHYMDRIAAGESSNLPLIISRVALPKDFQIDKSLSLCAVRVSANVPIEQTPSLLHADFANRFPGGGALSGGCVQEEILFVIKPESLISQLVVSVLEDSDAFLIEGAEQFSLYSGYGRQWQYAGSFHADMSKRCILVGIDATVNRFGQDAQFADQNFMRDIRKCMAGLYANKGQGEFATGNWGCGAFGGDKHLKAFQQLIAASAMKNPVYYCSFGDANLAASIERFVAHFQNATIGELLQLFEKIRDEKRVALKNSLLDEMVQQSKQ